MPRKQKYKISKGDDGFRFFTMSKGRNKNNYYDPKNNISSNPMKFGGEGVKVNFYLKSVWDKATLFWRKK